MTARAAALTAAQAQRAAGIQQLLQSGRTAEAISAAATLAREAARAPDAQHLLALCLASAGRFAEAEPAFRAALALLPGQVQILANFARMLRRAGRAADAAGLWRQVTGAQPRQAEAWTESGLARLDAGDAAGARAAFERATALAPSNSVAWHGLGNACRALHDLDAADAALRRALALAPGQGALQLNLGAVQRLRGRPLDALQHYEAAARLGIATPELRDARIGALVDLGRVEEALAEADGLLRGVPGFVPGHVTLAHLLWEHGARLAPGRDPLAGLQALARERPHERPIQLALIRLLIESGRIGEALEALARWRPGADDPVRAMLEADALDRHGAFAEAARIYRDLANRGALVHPEWINAHARHLIRSGQPEAAAREAGRALESDPDNQTAWAYLGTAWRLLGDAREHWLCDYERLCALVPVPGFADDEDALQRLAATLLPRHRAAHEPMQQSLRGGSQTPGRLFGGDDPVLEATRAALLRAIETRLATLPSDSTHPYLRRRARSVHLLGSWSVRLWSSGRHIDHIHHEGWMSSAFYVALPPSVRAAGDDAGALQLGRPPQELGLDLPPRRVLHPKPGHLALFPSYVWHGTVPFEDVEPRLTIAFDMQPRA